MTKIEAVEVLPVALPLEAPIAFSTRQVSDRHYTLVRIRDSDGVTGIGFCYAGHAGSTVVAEAVQQLLRPVLLGRDPEQITQLNRAMTANSLLLGRGGAVARAISAIDIALWDLRARKAARPLWRLLGAENAPVPLYASGGYYLDGKGVDGLVEEAEAWVAAGFDRIKIKVGRLDIATEVERVRRVREAIGPNRELMLDANNAWHSIDEALEFLRRIEEYDPYWIEEPFGPTDVAAHAHLVTRSRALVTTGEQSTGVGELEAFLAAKAVDILQPDAAVCGGVSEYLRIANSAASVGVGLAPHWFDSVHVHLVAATPISRFVEYFTDDTVFNFRKLLDRRMHVESGMMMLPEADGLGFEFDNAVCDKYSVRAWS